MHQNQLAFKSRNSGVQRILKKSNSPTRRADVKKVNVKPVSLNHSRCTRDMITYKAP